MSDLYAPCCADHLPDLSGNDNATFEELAASLLQQVWDTKGIPEGSIDARAVTAYAEHFLSGIETGIDWDTPDKATLQALRKNIWHFSTAKNYQQLKSLSEVLIGDDGKLRTYNEFKQFAFAINDKHVNQWLKAEYELAVAGSQMAGKWEGIVAQMETLPLLEFDAVLDTQTTALCRSLHGTILPVDHAFWKMYYPPNHFGCRSTVRQLTSGKITSEIPHADIPKMFQTNLGQQRLIFPPKHPYFDGLPNTVIDAADKLFKDG